MKQIGTVTDTVTSMERCPFCGAHLVRRFDHNPRRVISLSGEYWIREHVQRCSNKDCKGFKTSFRSEELQRIIIPYKIFSLGVVINIGTLRYEEHKTYAEIIAELSKKGIKISRGEVFNLCQTFESLVKGWHEERVTEIKEKLKEYVLSVDGTYSYRDKTLYIFRDYTSGLLLYASLASDDNDSVQPLFERVIEMYGKPGAVISDMQPAFIKSVENLLPGVPHQYCQQHFLTNAGGFMEDDYRELGKKMKKERVSAKAEVVEKEIEKYVEEEIGQDCAVLGKENGNENEKHRMTFHNHNSKKKLLLQFSPTNAEKIEGEIEEYIEEMIGQDCDVQDRGKENENEEQRTNRHDPDFAKKLLLQLIIIQWLCRALKVSSDFFPFDLYYVKLYERYKVVRAVIRTCIKKYTADDKYKRALCELERVLTSVIDDEDMKKRVKRLKYDYGIFGKLRNILRNEDKKSKGDVMSRMKRFLSFIENKARNEDRYKSLSDQIKRCWCGLFHTYDDSRIPRTNNDMESFIGMLRRKWLRMTGTTNADEWIVFHAPTGIYLFNLIGDAPPLEKLGFSTDLLEILSSVHYKSYRMCEKEYVERRSKDRIRKKANRNIGALLKSVMGMNEILISEV